MIIGSYTLYNNIDTEYTTAAIAIKPPTEGDDNPEALLGLGMLFFLGVLSTFGQMVVALANSDAWIHDCGSPFFTVTLMLPVFH